MNFPISDSRIDLSHSSASIQINRVVKAVTGTDAPAYHVTLDAEGDEQFTSTSLSELFNCVPQICETYADRCDDEHQDVFWMAYREIGLEHSPLGLVCLNDMETGYLSSAQSMNALADKIRLLLSYPEVERS
jgi:hypothetical protein